MNTISVTLHFEGRFGDSFSQDVLMASSFDYAKEFYIGKWFNVYSEGDYMMKCVNVTLNDTPLSLIEQIELFKEDGLYFMYDGEKITPKRLYFGIDTETTANGCAYAHYDCALRPVYKSNGERLRMDRFVNVCAEYRNGVVCDFYRE